MLKVNAFIILIILLIEESVGFMPSVKLPINRVSNNKPSIVVNKPFLISNNNNVLKAPSSSTALMLDIFGLGPGEGIIIVIAAFVLFGPNRVKSQLRDNGVEGQIISEGFRKERFERMKDMRQKAELARRNRALKRINQAVEEGDQYVIDKLDEYERLENSKTSNY